MSPRNSFPVRTILSISLIVTISLTLAACNNSLITNATSVNAADQIFFGGDILTMVGDQPSYPPAMAVKDGKIIALGSMEILKSLVSSKTQHIDLKGKTILPGFIDTHGHMIYFGKNLIDADLRGSKDIPELMNRLKTHVANVPEGSWIVGFGYQTKQMTEKRAPTIEELDQVSTTRPIMIVDSSGHAGAGNSALFKATGVSGKTKDPVGGTFYRKPGSNEILGPMEETALNFVRNQRPPFKGEQADQVALKGANLWASYGQTTAMDCGVGLGNDDIAIVRNAIDKKLLPIDLYVCAKDTATNEAINAAYSVAKHYNKIPNGTSKQLLAENPDLDKRYINRVRLGGIKFWLDGSLDTAWMTQNYSTNPPDKKGTYKGYQQIPNKTLDEAFDKYWSTNMQINMHMNGDAAADQAINAIEKAIKKYGMKDHRPVFIHASYLRQDQIEKMKKIGAIPTFLIAGVSGSGEAVVHLWGQNRASVAAATNTFVQQKLPFTLSHDAPVSPTPSVIDLISSAVNRTTFNGLVVGPDQRVTPYEAIKGVTSYAAYQIKEEKTKGTLEVGKLADFVILDKNPIKVSPDTIKDIQVLETIKEGKSVFQLNKDSARKVGRMSFTGSHEHSHLANQLEFLTLQNKDTLKLLAIASSQAN